MTIEQYYTPPSEEVFADIKQAAIQLWETFDDTYGYATGKVARIKDILNVKDNYAFIVAMFDSGNKVRLIRFLERDDSVALVVALIDEEHKHLMEILTKPLDPPPPPTMATPEKIG